MPDPNPAAYVFGYASLVALRDPVEIEGAEYSPVPGRLNGFRRRWAVAMDNWDAANDHKHFLDPGTGKRPRVRVAYPDVEPSEGGTVNGLAIPVDAARLDALDAREVNYRRAEVSKAFEPAVARPVFAYVGTDAARERCQAGIAQGNIYVSGQYLAGVREAFARLGADALAEFEQTTEPMPFAEMELERIWLEG